MASTITTTILVIFSVQFCLAALLFVRFPGTVRRALRLLIDFSYICSGERRKGKRTVIRSPRTPRKAPGQLVAIDRPKTAPAVEADPIGDDIAKALVDLGSSKPAARQLVSQARQANPNADADVLLRACFKLLKTA